MRALKRHLAVLAALFALGTVAFSPQVALAQDTLSKPLPPEVNTIRLSDQPPQALELTEGVRARVLAVDTIGRQLRLEGMVLEADRTSFRMSCLITGSRTPSIPPSGIPRTESFTCDSGTQEIRWSQVEDFRVRRAHSASSIASLRNAAAGTFESGLVLTFVGAAAAALTQMIWTTSDLNGDASEEPRFYWPDVRNVAIGFGAVGALAGGASAWRWSRGSWVKMHTRNQAP